MTTLALAEWHTDLERSSLYPQNKMLVAITISVCGLAAFTSIGMLAAATFNYNPGSWVTVATLGAWDSLVYLGIILTAIVFRDSWRASSVVALGAAAIASFSLVVLYLNLRPYFTPPTLGFRVINCAGPLVELGLPILQWPALGAVIAIAYRNARVGSQQILR